MNIDRSGENWAGARTEAATVAFARDYKRQYFSRRPIGWASFWRTNYYYYYLYYFHSFIIALLLNTFR